MKEQPEALRLATWLDHVDLAPMDYEDAEKAAAELRRLHAENGELLEALKQAARCVRYNYLPDKCGHDWDEVIAKAEGEGK